MANLAIPGWGNGGREDVITLFGGCVCDTTIGVDGRVGSVGGVMEKGEEEEDGGGGAMHGRCVCDEEESKPRTGLLWSCICVYMSRSVVSI